MITTSTPKKALSIMLAAALALTMIPSEALPEAYAAPSSAGAGAVAEGAAQEGVEAAQDQDAAETDIPSAADDPSSSAAGSAADAADADAVQRPVAVVQSTERVAEGAAKAPVEMTRASVSLATGEADAPAVFTQGPLCFQVNTDNPTTAAVVGAVAGADATDLAIPSTVTLSGTVYSVTRIIGGGGSAL